MLLTIEKAETLVSAFLFLLKNEVKYLNINLSIFL